MGFYLSSVCTASFLKRFCLFIMLGICLYGMKALNAADRLPTLTVRRTAVVALPRRSAAPPTSTLSMAVVAVPRRSAIVSPPLPLLEKPVPPFEVLGESSAVVARSANVDCDRDETSSCAGLSTSSLPEGISLM